MKKLVREYTKIPVKSFYLREGSFSPADADQGALLETYFNDIYHLFLNKLVKVTYESSITDGDALKLRQLLEEILKIKSLIQKSE